jgi:hypothetical protein
MQAFRIEGEYCMALTAALQELGYTRLEPIQGDIRACIDVGMELATHLL